MSGDGADPCDLVGSDSNSETSATDENGAISFTVCDLVELVLLKHKIIANVSEIFCA